MDQIGGVYSFLTGDKDTADFARMKRMSDIYRKLSPEDTTTSYLTKVLPNVSSELYPIIEKEIMDRFVSIRKGNIGTQEFTGIE